MEEKGIDYKLIDNGVKGLEEIRNNEYDLILLDIAMPDFSGVDIINSLKSDELLKSKNIVVVTASSNQKLLEELRTIGVKDILKKPCTLVDLMELVEGYRSG